MDKILTISKIFIVSIGVITLGCSDENVDSRPDPVRPVIIPERISAGINEFALDFFKNLQQADNSDKNLFVSPLSLNIALGMLLNGAENETAAEILKTLKINKKSHSN